MEYKKIYTPEEIHAVSDWFRRHADELPESVMLDAATRVNDVRSMVKALLDIYANHGDKATFSGQIFQLFKLKERLVADGLADD